MHSQLFRRETGRHIHAARDRIAGAYLDQRPQWMSALSSPNRDILRGMIETLAQAVDRGDVEGYRRYTCQSLEGLIDDSYPPILLLAAAELFERVVRTFLTPDQQKLVDELFEASRLERQAVMYRRVIDIEARGA